MSTAEHPGRVIASQLVEGSRLEQPEFHRRYTEEPVGVRAELIEGGYSCPVPSAEHTASACPRRRLAGLLRAADAWGGGAGQRHSDPGWQE